MMIIRNKNDNNKKQKVNNDKEGVLFNTDTLSKITSYLPSTDLLNLGLTSKRFSAPFQSNNDKPSLIEESARIAVQDIATEEQLAVLPYYQGSSSLEVNHHLQLLRGPLTFDQLVGAEYVEKEDKSCVKYLPILSIESIMIDNYGYKNEMNYCIGTAFSNNIMAGGKHYATFKTYQPPSTISKIHHPYELGRVLVGVMRPGEVNAFARDVPFLKDFYENFHRHTYKNNGIQCCMYDTGLGDCISSDWIDRLSVDTWERSVIMIPGDEIGMLLDLDEGMLTVYKNGRKLGVMRRGLAGPYCWVVSMFEGAQVTIQRGTIPPS